MMPDARRYRVFPLGTFHYFDWQKTDKVGISIGTSPQIVSSETADIGLVIGGVTRILPFSENHPIFEHITQEITPLTTVFHVSDSALPITATITFRSCFYPQDFEISTIPAYMVVIEVHNPTSENVEVDSRCHVDGYKLGASRRLAFPDGIDHDGIDDFEFTQTLHCNAPTAEIPPHSRHTFVWYHLLQINEPTLNVCGEKLKFGYTTFGDALDFLNENVTEINRKGDFFEQTILQSSYPPELKFLLSSAFKGLASNAWWAENGWFSVMEIGAYHSTLDVDYQLALFFFQYWSELVGRMLNQWADFYIPGSGYMAHDVGQHLEITGNRYGGPNSAMKVEENCNYLILLHHYWRSTGDDRIFEGKETLIRELIDFLIASDTSGNGLPNQYTDNTNDWGSGLITASEDQSYHGVRMVVMYRAIEQIAVYLSNDKLKDQCDEQADLILDTLDGAWLGDHYPISLSSSESFDHYSMWTTHGLLYAQRNGLKTGLDLDKLRIDLINSTQRTMHEHGSVHSTVDVRGWLTQNLWRDCIAAYLGVDMTANLRSYLGHGEYVSYEDTTILEVANELMVVPGATAEHTYAGETHDFPMVDGHPRPACIFGLPYALAGLQFDWIKKEMSFAPIVFPVTIPLTHLADWKNERLPTVTFTRTIPNQDGGHQVTQITYSIEHDDLLEGWILSLREP